MIRIYTEKGHVAITGFGIFLSIKNRRTARMYYSERNNLRKDVIRVGRFNVFVKKLKIGK